MSTTSSSSSSLSSGGFNTEITTAQFEISSNYSDISETHSQSENETEIQETGVMRNDPGCMNYEIIDIDDLTKNDNTEPADQVDDEVDSPVTLRNPTRGSLDEAKRSSFKKQARLSRMLQEEDSSSSDDDDLYMMGSFQGPSSQFSLHGRSPVGSREHLSRNDLEKVQATALDEDPNVDRRESIPIHLLSKIVNPGVLSEVKAHLRQIELTKSDDVFTGAEPSPAKLWELRKKQQNDKSLFNKSQALKVKAGMRVRQCLNSLPEGETVNTLYLTLVKKDMLREVDAIFSLAKVAYIAEGFDKNYKDDDDKTALTIAIDNKNETMLSKLIEHGVDLGISVFHVIEANFLEGLKLLLLYDTCTQLKIKTENHYFQIGMTPMLLAAHNNNYRMLSLLHEYGHRLTELKDWSAGIHVAWESANERRMICVARAQPAYITLISEVNNMNPMKYCLKEIKIMREYAQNEHEFSSHYKCNIVKLEDYMCSLLDYICSSEELAELFQFEPPNTDKLQNLEKGKQLRTIIQGARTERWALGNRFKLLESASKQNLVRFVTHQQSQLALSYMRYRSLPYLRHNFIAILIGCMFPILSLFYVFAPDTFLGSIITLPTVSFSCHMMSDIYFALLLSLNIVLKDETQDCVGAGPTTLELILVLWILGKWIQELQECTNRGWKEYFRDYWNYTDLTMLFLFTTSILIRFIDLIYNNNNVDSYRCSRYEWEYYEPRLIAEGLQAWAYVFVFIRLLGIMRVDRYLGPLQVSLARMLQDIVRFLCLFSLVLCAFAFGLSDLYWYYGTKPGSQMFCKNNSDSNGTISCSSKAPFSNMGMSLVELFWALFGLFDLSTMSLSGKHYYTEVVGKTLVATYHVVAIIVMLNMLIAMMSVSYNDTSENEETAWKFHRTSMWIRFIRREVVRPPPMNLFPNPWRIKENFGRLKNFCQKATCCRSENLTGDVYNSGGKRIRRVSTMNSRLDYQETDGRFNENGKTLSLKAKATRTGCSDETATKDKSVLIENEVNFADVTNLKCDRLSVQPVRSSPVSGHASFNNAKFSPAVLTGVKNAIRRNFNATESKKVVRNLVQRYKLKCLVTKESHKTLQIV